MRTTKSKLMLLCVLLLSVLITGCLNKTAVLTTLEITPKEVSLDVGQTQEFTVVGKDADGKITDINPSWVVTDGIGTVSPTEGKTVIFEATTSGSGTIKVTTGDISATAQIKVNPKLTTLEITPAEVSLDVGQIQEFSVVAKDADGKIIDINPSWVVTDGIGTVSSTEGKTVIFEATTSGSGTIKVTTGDISATAQITVDPKLTTLEITPAEVSLDRGETQEFSVVGKDENGNVMDFTPSWGVNGEIGTISSTEGKIVIFDANTYGSGTVKVTAGDITATSQINVELTESRVNSFMENYKEHLVNEDAEKFASLYSDPFTQIFGDYGPKYILRDDFILNLKSVFEEADYICIEWEVTIEDNIGTINSILNNKGDSWDINHYVEWTVKNIEGSLYIVIEKEEV